MQIMQVRGCVTPVITPIQRKYPIKTQIRNHTCKLKMVKHIHTNGQTDGQTDGWRKMKIVKMNERFHQPAIARQFK